MTLKYLAFDTFESPIGEVLVVVDDGRLCFCDFNDNQARIEKLLQRRFGGIELVHESNPMGVVDRLKSYFDGDLSAIDDIPLSMGGSDFQDQVWEALQKIPAGQTISYNQLAQNIKNERAIRAVASANANNPVSIVVPCHRVIGKDGTMRGYAGGIERKVWLLKHEGAILC